MYQMTRSSNGGCRKCRLDKIDPLVEEDLYKRLIQERGICTRYNREKAARSPDSVKRWLARPTLALVDDRGREYFEIVPQYLDFPVVDIRCLLTEDSNCGICFDNYRNDDGSIRERCLRLPCGHTLCQTCVQGWLTAREQNPQLIENLDEDYLTCPFCRHPLLIVQHDYPAWQKQAQEQELDSEEEQGCLL